jgi:hypothetical protein
MFLYAFWVGIVKKSHVDYEMILLTTYLNCKVGTTYFKYLELPIGDYKKIRFFFIIDRIRACLSH